VAFRFIASNQHPDHDTIAAFQRRFLRDGEKLFVHVLMLAREMGMLKMGTVEVDGTRIHANASRYSGLSCQIRPTFPTAHRSSMNWRGTRSVCGRSLRRVAN
jgi:hypothetical protein